MLTLSKSLISMISVFNLSLTISLQICSLCWLFMIPMCCSDLSVIRSKTFPTISFWEFSKTYLEINRNSWIYLYEEFRVHGILSTMSFVPVSYFMSWPLVDWARSGLGLIYFCIIRCGICDRISVFHFLIPNNFRTTTNNIHLYFNRVKPVFHVQGVFCLLFGLSRASHFCVINAIILYRKSISIILKSTLRRFL